MFWVYSCLSWCFHKQQRQHGSLHCQCIRLVINWTFREEVRIDDRTFPWAEIDRQCRRLGENSLQKLLKNSISRFSRSMQAGILAAEVTMFPRLSMPIYKAASVAHRVVMLDPSELRWNTVYMLSLFFVPRTVPSGRTSRKRPFLHCSFRFLGNKAVLSCTRKTISTARKKNHSNVVDP